MEELQGGYYFEQTEPKAKVEIRSKIHSTHELGKRAVVQRNQNVFVWIRRKKHCVLHPEDKAFDQKYTIKILKYRGESVMIWGFFQLLVFAFSVW